MNIIKRELRSNWIHLLIWSLAFFLMSYAAIIKFDSIITTGPEVLALLNSFPRILLALFGMVDVDIATLPGYFSVVALYLMLMAASQGMFLGIRLFAREEQDKTADFLLVKPRTRRVIFWNKVMAGILMILILQGVLLLVNILALRKYLPDARMMLVNYTLAFMVVHGVFFAIGVWLISRGDRKRVDSIGLAIILVSYFVPVIANLSESLAFLKAWFPLNAFLQADMAEATGTPYLKLAIGVGISVVALLWGQWRFEKKDILT